MLKFQHRSKSSDRQIARFESSKGRLKSRRNKMSKLIRITILSLLPVCILLGYVADYPQSMFSFFKQNGYDRIKALKFTLHGEPGTPELPVVYLNYIIPPNAKVESLIIKSFDFVQLAGSYLIYPNQKTVPIGESMPWIPPDTLIYNNENLYPGKVANIIDQGVFDGARIVTVAICPVQYRPKSKGLVIVRNIDFDFSFSSSSDPKLKPIRRGIYEQGLYTSLLKYIVINDNEIASYYQQPALVEEGELYSQPAPQYAPAVIITPTEFWNAFIPYRDWMTDQGIRTVLVDPQSIYQAHSGCDNAEKIRNYIKYCYQYYGGTYFILGGDDYFVPVRWCVEDVADEDTIVPADLYFSDLSGNWDFDNDGKWGERIGDAHADSADRFPEVYVGRITAYTSQEVQNWVIKALHYEKTPGVIFDFAVWIYSSIVGTGNAPSVFPAHFTHIYAQDYWANDAITLMNQGHGIMNINCHGNAGDYRLKHNPNANIHSWWDAAPNLYEAGLNWLANLNKYPIGYAIACYVGAYDSLAHPIYYENGTDTCIADAYVDAYLYNHQGMIGPLGTCAFLANTRNGLWQGGGPSYDLQYAFWNRIMNPWWVGGGPPEPSITRIGVAEASSKCDELIDWFSYDGRYVCYGHTLFGSPYTEVWTKTPSNMSVTHPSQVYVNVQTQFTVTVRTSTIPQSPLQYAKVCLNKSGDIYVVGTTNANGQVTFTIRPRSTGTIKVTVTRLHNADNNYSQYRPSQTNCQVVDLGGEQSSGSSQLKPPSLCIIEMPVITKDNVLIKYGLPKDGDIAFMIYDASGSLVNSIQDKKQKAGYYQKMINTKNLANGIYFVALQQNQVSISRKLLIVK